MCKWYVIWRQLLRSTWRGAILYIYHYTALLCVTADGRCTVHLKIMISLNIRAVNLQIFWKDIFVLYRHTALSITAIHSLCCYYLYLHSELSSAETDTALLTQHAFHSLCCRLRLKCDGTRAETRFRLSAKRTSPFKSVGASVQSTTGSRGVRISGSNGSNAGYTMFRGSVKGTGYPLHSPLSPSLPRPCFNVCHHISTRL